MAELWWQWLPRAQVSPGTTPPPFLVHSLLGFPPPLQHGQLKAGNSARTSASLRRATSQQRGPWAPPGKPSAARSPWIGCWWGRGPPSVHTSPFGSGVARWRAAALHGCTTSQSLAGKHIEVEERHHLVWRRTTGEDRGGNWGVLHYPKQLEKHVLFFSTYPSPFQSQVPLKVQSKKKPLFFPAPL